MTHRRLFHILLVGSTLVLAAAWWRSFITGSILWLQTSTSPLALEVFLVHANVNLTLFSNPGSGWNIELHSVPASDYLPHSESTPRPGLLGDFEWIEASPQAGPHPTLHGLCRLTFPMWVPYLCFVTGALVLTRMMERRSGRERAKAQAGR